MPSALDQLDDIDSVVSDDNEPLEALKKKKAESPKKKREISENEISNVVKKKRILYTLNPTRLIDDNGLPALTQSWFKDFQVRKNESELHCLNRILNTYEEWIGSMGVKESSSVAEFVEKLDRLKKNDIRRYMVHARINPNGRKFKSHELSSIPSQISKVEAERSQVSQSVEFKAANNSATDDTQIDDEVKARIQRNKEEALKRLALRKQQQQQQEETDSQQPTQQLPEYSTPISSYDTSYSQVILPTYDENDKETLLRNSTQEETSQEQLPEDESQETAPTQVLTPLYYSQDVVEPTEVQLQPIPSSLESTRQETQEGEYIYQ